MMLRLSREVETAIREAGAAAWPNECCGILFGREADGRRAVEAAKPIVNAREDGEQYHRFLITAEDMLQAELEARRSGREILGFYHSHPDHPAKPSDYDREHALPGYTYLILQVEQGRPAALTGWQLRPDREAFVSEPFTVEP